MTTVDLTGQRFGRLQVIEFSHKDKFRQKRWKCLCDCGNQALVAATYLIRNLTNSCGCLHKEMASEKNKTHGFSSGGKISPEARTWYNVRNRCLNERSQDYHLYGERGIKICDRWLESFENFYEDMGKRPSSKHSIERIDVNGNYEPNNCEWATDLEQSRNKRAQKRSKSGVSGVTLTKKSGKWRATISDEGKDYYLGEHTNVNDAIKARKEAEIKYWNKIPS